MLIANEYGRELGLSTIVDSKNHIFDLSKEVKSKPSEFDMLLSFFQNSSASKVDVPDSRDISNLGIADKVSQRENLEERPTDPVEVSSESSSIESLEETDKREKLREESLGEKRNLLDVKYVSEINKKVNALLDRIQKDKYPSEEQTRIVASELQFLIHQFQKFAEHIKNSEGLQSLATQQNPRDRLLAQLLERMGHKLDLAKGLLKNMEISSQSVASQVVSTQKGVELRLAELKQVDGELTKTLQLLSDLKKVAQEGQTALQNAWNSSKPSSDAFVSANFGAELAGAKNRNHGKTESSKSGILVQGQRLEAPVSPPSTSTSSGFSQGGSFGSEQFSSQGGWNMTGISGGLGLHHMSALDMNGVADAARMGFREKVLLGQEILQQMGQEMKGVVGKRESHFSISLKPEELGDVKVILDMKDGVIKSQIVVQNEAVKDILKMRFEDVKDLFLQNGIEVSEFGIHTESEFQDQSSSSSRESMEEAFQTQKHLAGQVRLQRYLQEDAQSTWVYGKVDDSQKEWNNFTIVI